MLVKKLFLLLFLLILFFNDVNQHAYAQKESNNWYFGANAGITFNTVPPTALTNGALSTSEGCSSISDENGNLLFYSNGNYVWNKNHQLMDNGDGLLGAGNSTQSSLFVKMPGSTTLYYVFTVPDQLDEVTGYRYSIVDLTFNGGLGKVTTLNHTILKDFSDVNSVFENSTEALTAALHSNKRDIWIVLHESKINRFYSYLLTPSGLQAPVVSQVGNQKSYLGQCRISPDGKRIAVGGYFGTGLDLFEFNSTTGNISNHVPLIVTAYTDATTIYGLSFSPNSNVLYVTNSIAEIFQFDLSLSTSTDIINSKVVVGQGSGNSYPQIQLGPNKEIYLAQDGKGYLGVIKSPDVIGSGCNFVDNGISLNGKISTLGLPTFMVNYVTERPTVVSIGNDTTLCPKAQIVLDAGNPGATYLWNTHATTQKITITEPGKYYVDVTSNNVQSSDTIRISYLSFSLLNMKQEYAFCKDDDSTLVLNPSFTETTFHWQDGSSTIPYTIRQPGVYTLERSNQGCSRQDAFTVTSNCQMIISNLITPNKDGLNETFVIKNLPIPDWNIEIYNRWGTLVYNAEGYQNNWGNQNVSDGIYYYQLKNRYSDETHKGWLEVLSAAK